VVCGLWWFLLFFHERILWSSVGWSRSHSVRQPWPTLCIVIRRRGFVLVTPDRTSCYLNKFSRWPSDVLVRSPSFLFRACSSRSRSRTTVRTFVSACVRECVSVSVYVRGLRRSVTRVRSYREAILFRVQKHLSSFRVYFTNPSRLQPVSSSGRIGFSVFADVVGVARTSNYAMACATLKRSLDFEPPMCRPTKRQRCTPMSISPSSSPPNSSRSEYVSPHFGGDAVPKITAGKDDEFFLSRKRRLSLWLLLLLLLLLSRRCRWRRRLL